MFLTRSASPVVFGLVLAATVGAVVRAQNAALDRLPVDTFDVVAPSARVSGAPGDMSIRSRGCRTVPSPEIRRRLVEVAVQEWAYFGFSIVDQSDADADDEFDVRRWRRRPDSGEAARVASSIAGYWTAAPGGDWILENQNEIWQRSSGTSARWRYPWSAAFISWVMCEGGLGSTDRFQRAIAHHTYIDQAIRARDAPSSRAAFVAHDVGEATVAPGDLLCSARRPAYRTLAQRRRQLGEGARTHCDLVVKVDAEAGHILAIGGNVRGTVSLKVLPAESNETGWRPVAESRLFAHLELRAGPAPADVFDASPTVRALGCAGTMGFGARRAAADLVAPLARRCAS